ncbi:MAG: ABC transporter ATP-binding protein [Pseudomonadota bacterium]
MISVQNLTVKYAPRSPDVLCKCSVDFADGSFTAVVGPNGCGKSTLLKSILKLIPVESGLVKLGSRPIHEYSRKELAREIAFLPQSNACPDYLTVEELVELGTYSHAEFLSVRRGANRERVAEALLHVGLSEQAGSYVNQLSGGQQQRAFLGMVLAQDAQILMLDEPINHLDLQHQHSLLQLLKELVGQFGKTVIAVLHDLNLAAQYAERLVLMHKGAVALHDSIESAFAKPIIEQVFDVTGQVVSHERGRVFVVENASSKISEHL